MIAILAIIIYTNYSDYEKIASGYIVAYSHRHFADESGDPAQLGSFQEPSNIPRYLHRHLGMHEQKPLQDQRDPLWRMHQGYAGRRC